MANLNRYRYRRIGTALSDILSGGLRGVPPAHTPPMDQNFFNFIGFFRKYD